MKIYKLIIFTFLILFSKTAFSFDVKGLELGEVTSHQELADRFGNANCPINHATLDTYGITCTVPISYLGIKTTAKIDLDKQWIVKNVWIDIPLNMFTKVEDYVHKQYGKPNVLRGTKIETVTGLKRLDGTPVPAFDRTEPCSNWSKLDGVYIALCYEYMTMTYLKFSYKTPQKLDESDT